MRVLYMVGLTFVILAGSALVIGVLQQTSASRGACCVEDGCTSTSETNCENVGGRWLSEQSCVTDVCAIPATPAPTVPIVGDPCNITLFELELSISQLECEPGDTTTSQSLISVIDRRSPECDPLVVELQCEFIIAFRWAQQSTFLHDIEFQPILDFEWSDGYSTTESDAFNLTGTQDLAFVGLRLKRTDFNPGDQAFYSCYLTSDEYPLRSYGFSPIFPKDVCV
jgi:hypothetical protein